MSVEEIIIQLKEIQRSNGRVFDQQHFASNEAIDNAIKLLRRPKGKWRTSRVHGGIVKCDFCGFQWGSNEGRKFNFCPNCGADMRGEE